MTQSNIQIQLGQAPRDFFLGGVMQRQISNSDRGLLGKFASRIGAVLALATVFLLSACDGTGSSSKVTDVSQTEPGKDGVPPVLTVVTILPNGLVEAGDQVRIDFTASEALMTPVVFINGVRADVTGKIAEWSARHDITDTDPDGLVVVRHEEGGYGIGRRRPTLIPAICRSPP